MVPHSMTLTDA